MYQTWLNNDKPLIAPHTVFAVKVAVGAAMTKVSKNAINN